LGAGTGKGVCRIAQEGAGMSLLGQKRIEKKSNVFFKQREDLKKRFRIAVILALAFAFLSIVEGVIIFNHIRGELEDERDVGISSPFIDRELNDEREPPSNSCDRFLDGVFLDSKPDPFKIKTDWSRH
jgi:hypothetical protein